MSPDARRKNWRFSSQTISLYYKLYLFPPLYDLLIQFLLRTEIKIITCVKLWTYNFRNMNSIFWWLIVVQYFRVNLAESLPIVLKKEYGCHRRDILKTEQCLSRQLESSMSASQIIMELNDLENSNSFSKRSKIWMILFVAWLCPSIGRVLHGFFPERFH